MPEEEPCAKPKPARKSFGWPFWLFLAVLISILAGFVNPAPRQNIRANQVEALNNLRQIGLSLHEFEGKFGEFPSDDTVALVIMRHSGSSHGLNGSSSNALFRQLFAAEVAEYEQMLYAKVPGVRRPDGDISPGKLLEKGEVAFAYIAGLTSEGNPARVIAFCPIIPGTDRFDPKPFLGRDRLQPRQYRGFHAHPPPRFHRRFQRRHDPQPVPRIVGAIFGRPPFFRL